MAKVKLAKSTRTIADVEAKIKELVKTHWEECEEKPWKSFNTNPALDLFIDTVYWWFGFENSADCGENDTEHFKRWLELDRFLDATRDNAKAPYLEILRERRERYQEE